MRVLTAGLRPKRGVRRQRVLEPGVDGHPPDFHRLQQHLQQERDPDGPLPERHVSPGG